MDGHVPQNSDTVILGESRGFMLIPSFLHLNAKLFADLPVQCAAALLWQWMFSVLASSGPPETRWSMVSSKRPHSLHFGSTSGFLRMLYRYQRVVAREVLFTHLPIGNNGIAVTLYSRKCQIAFWSCDFHRFLIKYFT